LQLVNALVEREHTTDGEQDDRYDEGVHVALAAVAEGMLGVRVFFRLLTPEQQEGLIARVGNRVHTLGQHRT